MTESFAHAVRLRAPLVVLSDRRPAPGAPRTGLESAIERALLENDGVWLVQRAATVPDDAGEREPWSVLDGAAEQRPAADGWAGYLRANATYAERIAELINPDGTVWINGHRWLLVASALRGHGHRGPIGLILDVPFPAHARIEELPWHADLMAALCQHDLVGLRTAECADNFEASRLRLGQSRPWIGVFPDNATTRATPADWVTSFLQLVGFAARRDPRRGFIG